MVFADLEGTMTEGVAELSYANSAGKLTEAERILKHMLEEERKNLCKAETIDQFIRANGVTRQLHVTSGAELLKGHPPSILLVPLTPNKASTKVYEMGERDRNISVVTCADIRTAHHFCREHKVPFYNIAASSELGVDSFSGLLTGGLERYCDGEVKAKAYTGKENVVGNSTGDLPLFKKAIENGFEPYFVRGGGQSPMEEICSDALEKFGLSYKTLSL